MIKLARMCFLNQLTKGGIMGIFTRDSKDYIPEYEKGDRVRPLAAFNGVELTDTNQILGSRGALDYLIGNPCINLDGLLTVELLTNGYHSIEYKGNFARCKVGAREETECVCSDPLSVNDIPFKGVIEERLGEKRDSYYANVEAGETGEAIARIATESIRLGPEDLEKAIRKTVEAKEEKKYCPYCGQRICDC